MAIGTSLSRVGKFDFFAIMAPGFFLLVGVMMAVGLFLGHGHIGEFWRDLEEVGDDRVSCWALALGTLFLSYILGTIPRAISVDTADRLAKHLAHRPTNWLADCLAKCLSKCSPKRFPRGWRGKNPFVESLYSEEFPYAGILERRLSILESQDLAEKTKSPQEKTISEREEKITLHTLFNFWKLSVCGKNPEVFAYTQEFESRVRLFAGMFWASLYGIIIGFVNIVLWAALSRAVRDGTLALVLGFLGASIAFLVLLGRRLRFMREDEVTHVFLSYLALLGGASIPPLGSATTRNPTGREVKAPSSERPSEDKREEK